MTPAAADQVDAGNDAPFRLNGVAGPYFTVLVRLQPEDRLRPDQRREGIVTLEHDFDSEPLT